MTTKTETVTITIPDDPRDLHHHYPGQVKPQPVYLELDPQERTVQLDWSGEIGHSVPEAIWNGRIGRYGVPLLTRRGYELLIDELRPLLDRVCDGHAVEWDGSNHVGELTEDAREADFEVQVAIQDFEFRNDPDLQLQVWDAADYYRESGDWQDIADAVNSDTPVGTPELSCESTDEDLDAIAKALESEARADRLEVHLLTGVEAYLEQVRAELAES